VFDQIKPKLKLAKLETPIFNNFVDVQSTY